MRGLLRTLALAGVGGPHGGAVGAVKNPHPTPPPRSAGEGGLRVAPVLVWLLVAACGEDRGEPPAPHRFALWSEFLSDEDVRAQIPLLVDEEADLYLAIPSARIGDAALADLVRALDDAGVGVRAWLLLPEADGYWPNEHNLAAMRTATMAFADWRDAEALPLDWVVFDMEMSLARTRLVADTIEADGPLEGLQVILDGEDEDFGAHRDELATLVGDLQARGLRVMCVTYPTVLDDLEDGDDQIQDRMDVPVIGVPWDEASFMVYQSLIYDLSGAWHGPDVIASYAETARARFGDAASVALGIVGSAGVEPVEAPYPDAPTLLADVGAARAAGIDRVSVYSLDGVLQQADPGGWLDAERAPETPAEGDAASLRGLVRTLLDP